MSSYTPAPQTADLAERIAAGIIMALKSERGVHAETAIATAAVLVGECVLRAVMPDIGILPGGSPIMDETVEQALYSDSGQLTISDVFMNALFAQGIDVSKDSWVENIPEEHRAIMDPLEVVARLRPELDAQFSLVGMGDWMERAYVAVSATALLVAQTRKVLDPGIGKSLALEFMLRGAKTVPLATPETLSV